MRKLTEFQLEKMANDLVIDYQHFLIFEAHKKEELKGLSFEEKRDIFNSIYHTCRVYK